MANPAKYVWLDDELKDAATSGVPIVNAGLHYGFTVFEGIRSYATDRGPAVFRLEEHVDRLLDSALIVGFRNLPWTRDTLIDAIHKTIAANKFSACYIRPVIYLDGAMDLVVDSGKPRLIIAVWEWTAFLGEEAKERGIRANIASFTRLHPNIMMTKAKVAGNYVSSILAKTESQRAGFDEAIMLDPQGYVAECTGENIFVVRNNVIYTPGRGAILEGITRDSLDHAGARPGSHRRRRTNFARPALYRRRGIRLWHRRRSGWTAGNRLPHHRQRKDRTRHSRSAGRVRQTHQRTSCTLRRVVLSRAGIRSSVGRREVGSLKEQL